MDVTQLAKLHGVSRNTIYEWLAAEPRLPQRDDGSFIVAETIAWRVQRELNKDRKTRAQQNDEPKLSEMNRKLRAEADLKELQLERERGSLIPFEMFEEKIGKVIGGFAAVAAGQLTRFERKAVQADTPAAARVLMQEIHRALMEGAQEFAGEVDQGALASEEVDE